MMLQELPADVRALEHDVEDSMSFKLDSIGVHGVTKSAHASEEVKDQMID